MKKVMAVLTMVALAACGGGTTTGPSNIEQPAQATATPAPAPIAPAAETPATLDVRWSPNASWAITNNGDGTVFYTAQYTGFEDQRTVLGSKDGDVRAGTTSEGSFGKQCVQVDLVPLGGGKIFGFAFFDAKGNPASPQKATESCKAPTPKPTPSVPPSCETDKSLCPPPPADVCSNIDGAQATVPQGYYAEGGKCYRIPTCAADEILVNNKCERNPDDVCASIPGMQEGPEYFIGGKGRGQGECKRNYCEVKPAVTCKTSGCKPKPAEYNQHHSTVKVDKGQIKFDPPVNAPDFWGFCPVE